MGVVAQVHKRAVHLDVLFTGFGGLVVPLFLGAGSTPRFTGYQPYALFLFVGEPNPLKPA